MAKDIKRQIAGWKATVTWNLGNIRLHKEYIRQSEVLLSEIGCPIHSNWGGRNEWFIGPISIGRMTPKIFQRNLKWQIRHSKWVIKDRKRTIKKALKNIEKVGGKY